MRAGGALNAAIRSLGQEDDVNQPNIPGAIPHRAVGDTTGGYRCGKEGKTQDQ
jgi:hypothetical protein